MLSYRSFVEFGALGMQLVEWLVTRGTGDGGKVAAGRPMAKRRSGTPYTMYAVCRCITREIGAAEAEPSRARWTRGLVKGLLYFPSRAETTGRE